MLDLLYVVKSLQQNTLKIVATAIAIQDQSRPVATDYYS